MNSLQQQVFIGSMLGDGSLQGNGHYNWKFCKKQKSTRKEYLDWHFSIFGDLSCSVNLGRQELTFDYYKKKGEKFVAESCLFSTHANAEFTKLGHKWYSHHDGEFAYNKHGCKIKVVPEDITLTPLSLAIWFCDDGTNAVQYRTAVFCTNGFTRCECELLKVKMLQTLNIKSTVHTSRSQPMIRIAAADYVNFIELIKPYVIWPCFQYKVECRLPKFGERHYNAKISDGNVLEIKRLHASGMKQNVLAKQFGVSPSCVCNILNGKKRRS